MRAASNNKAFIDADFLDRDGMRSGLVTGVVHHEL